MKEIEEIKKAINESIRPHYVDSLTFHWSNLDQRNAQKNIGLLLDYCDKLLSEFEKERERANRLEYEVELTRKIAKGHFENLEKAEEKVKQRESAINILEQDVQHEIILRNEWHEKAKELESRLNKLVEGCSKCGLAIAHGGRCPYLKVLEEVKGDLKDYTSSNLLVEQLTERIKELEAKLASTKADPSIGKLEIVNGWDDEEEDIYSEQDGKKIEEVK